MDFKATRNWFEKPFFILNIVRRARKKLVRSRSTYTSSSDWVTRQIQDALPFDETPREVLMDIDSIFAVNAQITVKYGYQSRSQRRHVSLAKRHC